MKQLSNCSLKYLRRTDEAWIHYWTSLDNTVKVEDKNLQAIHQKTMMSTVLRWVILVTFIALTICGNVLVCLAVATSRHLRRISNCFIVSLAVADLMLALLVLPFSAMLELRNGRWPLGGVFCNIYISLDVMLCTASILTLLAISVDRYLAISRPLCYPRRVTPPRVAITLTGIWVCSLAVSFLPNNLGWNTPDFRVHNLNWHMWDEGDEGRTCRYEWNNKCVLLFSIGVFYLPLLVMCGVYHRIFSIAREQVCRIRAATPSCVQSASASVREHKATVTLAAVLGAFVLCWFPYCTYLTYIGMRSDTKPSELTYSVVLWMGYLNSALNPILYPALNRDFRQAYGQLLQCRQANKGKASCFIPFQNKQTLVSKKQQNDEKQSDPTEQTHLTF